MSLVALDGTPLVMIGGAGKLGSTFLAAVAGNTTDAALEAVIFIGRIFTEDGASHTIDTTGSSSLGWRSGTVVFANAGTTVTVGLAAVDMTAGPPARAVAVANAITFDVGVTFTGGGGGITSAAWQTSVPTTGTKTIANGDLVAFAVQMVTRGGADSVPVSAVVNSNNTSQFPVVTEYFGGTYTNSTSQPNLVITFSDGTLGFFAGSYVASIGTTVVTWNSGSATKEYGNFFQMPVPVKVYGLVAAVDPDAAFDLVLYSDPLGTPVPEKTVAFPPNVVGSAAVGQILCLFPTPYTTTANQPLAGIVKPGASNVGSPHITLGAAAHQKAWQLGANCYAVNRATGAFAAQNSNMDRFGMALLVGAFDDGTAVGGSGGGGSVFGSKGGVIT